MSKASSQDFEATMFVENRKHPSSASTILPVLCVRLLEHSLKPKEFHMPTNPEQFEAILKKNLDSPRHRLRTDESKQLEYQLKLKVKSSEPSPINEIYTSVYIYTVLKSLE